MERNRIWLWTGFLTLAIAAALFLFWPRSGSLSWYETYQPDSRQPYGTEVIFELLKDQAGSDRFAVIEDSIAGSLEKWGNQPSNYVFIGEAMWLDSLDEGLLADFVASGNTLFISAKFLPSGLLSRLLAPGCPDDLGTSGAPVFPDTSVSLSLLHPAFQVAQTDIRYISAAGVEEYEWSYLDSSWLCAGLALGTADEFWINYLKIPYGKGTVLLHTTPLAFSNFYMKEEKGLDYSGKVLAYLNEGPVYWDHYSDSESAFRRNWGRRPPRTTRTLDNEGPLQYILSQTPLAWAWYIGLGLAVLYLLFRAKRRQRIIPVLDPNANTSMEFIATIGQLYFQQNNHRKLALQKWKLFLGFIRDRYHLPTRELDEAFIQKLAARSGVAEETLHPLFRLALNIERSPLFLSENTLIDLHQALDRFYRNCK
ncbi:MAG: hypothetical protein WA004_18335 [Saprospiraceae bacterium]